MLLLLGNGIAPTLHDYFKARVRDNRTISLLPVSIGKYKSSAPFSELLGEVKDQSVVFVQSLAQVDRHTTADFTWEFLLTVAELKRHGAKGVWGITPYDGHMRQDRAVNGRKVSIASDTFAHLAKHASEKGGIDGMSLIEAHSPEGLANLVHHFGAGHVFNLSLTETFAQDIEKRFDPDTLVVGGPDAGANERADALAKRLHCAQFQHLKERYTVDDTRIVNFIGDVDGKRTITVDDEIDTAGTSAHSQDDLRKRGAIDRHFYASHGVFSDGGLERIFTAGARNDRTATSITVSDTIDITFELERLKRQYGDFDDIAGRVRQVPVGPLLWDHITKDIMNHAAMQAGPA